MKNEFFIVGDEVYIKLPRDDGTYLWAITDIEDFHLVNKYHGFWRSIKARNTHYAGIRDRRKSKNLILMHRIILNPKNGLITDHENGLGWDNIRDNLRAVTYKENSANLHHAKTTLYYTKTILKSPLTQNISKTVDVGDITKKLEDMIKKCIYLTEGEKKELIALNTKMLLEFFAEKEGNS